MRLFYCIVHYGYLSITRKCLRSLNLKNYKNCVLCYTKEDESSIKLLKQEKNYKKLNLIKLDNNLGYAYALNKSISFLERFKYDYIVFCNNDISFSNKFNERLTRILNCRKFDIAGFTILDSKKNIWFNGGEIDKYRFSGGHKINKTDFVSGCCMLVSKKVIDTVGDFDEEYFMYYEDVDFCYRAKQKRFTINLIKLDILHYSEKSRAKLKSMEFYLARNRLKFMKKYASLNILLREYFRTPKSIYEYLLDRNFSGLKGFLKGLL